MLNIIAYTLGVIVKSKAMPRASRDAMTIETTAFVDKNGVIPDKPSPPPDKPLSLPDRPPVLPDKASVFPDKIPDKLPVLPDTPPAFPDKPSAFPDKIPDNLLDALSKTEKEFLLAIFPYLCQHGEISNRQAQTLTGKSADSARKYFAKLVRVGFLQTVGEKKARVYRLADRLAGFE
jgi:hypothetical protein